MKRSAVSDAASGDFCSAVAEYRPIGMWTRPNVIAPFQRVRVEVGAMPFWSAMVAGSLAAHPAAHAFLLERHGLYTWGSTIADAERHVEILEFLLETIGRSED